LKTSSIPRQGFRTASRPEEGDPAREKEGKQRKGEGLKKKSDERTGKNSANKWFLGLCPVGGHSDGEKNELVWGGKAPKKKGRDGATNKGS